MMDVHVKVEETDEQINIIARLPDVPQDQIELRWYYDGLYLAAKKMEVWEELNEDEQYFHKQQYTKRVERFIPIPKPVIKEQMKTYYDQSTLTIALPKKKYTNH